MKYAHSMRTTHVLGILYTALYATTWYTMATFDFMIPGDMVECKVACVGMYMLGRCLKEVDRCRRFQWLVYSFLAAPGQGVPVD